MRWSIAAPLFLVQLLGLSWGPASSEPRAPDNIHGHAFYAKDPKIIYFADLYKKRVCVSPHMTKAMFRPYGLDPVLAEYQSTDLGLGEFAKGKCDAIAIPFRGIESGSHTSPKDAHGLQRDGSGRHSPLVQKMASSLSDHCGGSPFDCQCVSEAFLKAVEGGKMTVIGDLGSFYNNRIIGKVGGVNAPYHQQCLKTERTVAAVKQACIERSRIWPSVPKEKTEAYCGCLAPHVLNAYGRDIKRYGLAKVLSGTAGHPLGTAMDDKGLCRS